jgi:3D (Asp-Asp-Asp) domain-containing protein
MKSRRQTLRANVLLVGTVLLLSGCAMLSTGEREDNREIRRMTVTAYDNGTSQGKNKTFGVTSSGEKARKGTIAADIRRYPYGTRMYVPGYGWGEVQDTGSAITGDRIDVFFPKKKDAISWGRKYLDVTIIKKME